MKLDFRIHYHTQWGQQLYVLGSIPELGAGDPHNAYPLHYTQDGNWRGLLVLREAPESFEYIYILKDTHQGINKKEWGPQRKFNRPDQINQVIFQDQWRDAYYDDNVLYTAAFSNAIFRPSQSSSPQQSNHPELVRLKLQIPVARVERNQCVCISGQGDALGNWNPEQALILGNPQGNIWETELLIDPRQALEYKYGIYDSENKKLVFLENRLNRRLDPELFRTCDVHTLLQVQDEYLQDPRGPWKGAGMAIPIFSLRTKQSLGCGEFKDLELLADWLETTGLKMIQILPINDTQATQTWTDSYPYASISVFALHPLYLNIESMGHLSPAEQGEIDRERHRLNALYEVDYEAVLTLKLKLAHQIFERSFEQLRLEASYRVFREENQDWLPAYAAFSALRDQFGTVDFNQWGAYSAFSEALLEELAAPGSETAPIMDFYYFLQYHLDQQLKAATQYTRQKGIAFKGDIPIGIYRYSVDAWVAPKLYNMEGQAGAPPDDFSETGQNWGFPTYNWDEMAKDGYQWWKRRFQQLSRYFDAFRIDHILGFFRIWETPLEHIQGLMGVFNPAIPLKEEDFRNLGIDLDEARFCQPYIDDQLLEKTFSEQKSWVETTFFHRSEQGLYHFKEAFDNQRKIEEYFKGQNLEKGAHTNGKANSAPKQMKKSGEKPLLSPYTTVLSVIPPEKLSEIKEGLFQLIANRLFFRDKDHSQKAFHPRIKMQETYSFQKLEAPTRTALYHLYNDYFYHRQEGFWKEKALLKLPAIKEATHMLICGEDLGMVPDSVPGVMRDLSILSLEIQRMSKNMHTEFLQENDISYWSVCSPSTHDMSPIRAWWEEMDPQQRARFYKQELGFRGRAPKTCQPYIATQMIYQHLDWPSIWAVFPLQDLLAIDEHLRRENPEEERINVPSNPQHYWRYRMHLKVEDLIEAQAFNDLLKEMLEETGRA